MNRQIASFLISVLCFELAPVSDGLAAARRASTDALRIVAALTPSESTERWHSAQSRGPTALPTKTPRLLANRFAQLRRSRLRPIAFIRPALLNFDTNWRTARRDPRAYAINSSSLVSRIRSSKTLLSTSRQRDTVTLSSSTTAGVKPWWSFQRATLPGIGTAGVNVQNGNLVVGSQDMAQTHKGLDFIFMRFYNSQSRHDTLGSDGSQPSVYGNNWTNNYDVHIASNSGGGISIFTETGARYDYTPTTSSAYPTGWQPPAGVFAVLSLNTDGTYSLTAKDGSIEQFYPPAGTGCPTPAVCGRLEYLIGRNHYTNLTFTYGFSSSSYALSSLSEITVKGEDGETATLEFTSTANGPLLSELIWPGGQTVSYGYDDDANLNSVDEVGNNNSWIPQSYGYTGSQLQYVTDPRFSNSSNSGPCGDGGYEQFIFDSSNRITALQGFALVDFAPSDGTNTILQPAGDTGCPQFMESDWAYTNATSTAFSDKDGHSETLSFDALGRTTAVQQNGVSGSPTALATWNVSNEMTSETDPRGYVMNFAYDANGDQTAISEPSQTTSSGTLNPTWTYAFDANSNMIAACDANWNASHSTNWSGTGTPPTCAVQSGVATSTWTVQSYEPYGELQSLTTPRGYTRTFAYNSSNESGGDYGLATSIAGSSISQVDGTTTAVAESFTYDSHGNCLSYNFGPGAWYFTYDSTNRIVTSRDPDGFLGYRNYFPNGSLNSTESAYQYSLEKQAAGSGAVTYAYDPDDNETSVTHHFGGVAGISQFFYDGGDRLVEALQPVDKNDEFQYPYLARYLYDNTMGGSVSITSPTGNVVSFSAHGNLFSQQFYIPTAAAPSGGNGWRDYRGVAFDAADRETQDYSLAPTSAATRNWAVATASYGSSTSNMGEVISSTDETGVETTYGYTPLGQLNALSYSDGVSPSSSFTFDPNGNLASSTKSDIGTETTTYDLDGNVATHAEAATNVTSPATYTYAYYLDGKSKSISVSSSALSVTNLFQFAHRVDGLPTKEIVAYSAAGRSSQNFSWTYSPAGRLDGAADDEQKTTLSYDVNGEPTTLNLPGHTLDNSFDPEGMMTGYTITSPTGSMAYQLNNRGETVSVNSDWNGNSSQQTVHPFAGMVFPDSKNTLDTPVSIAYDPVNSAKLAEKVNNSTEFATLSTTQLNWTYDSAGRVTQKAVGVTNNTNLASSVTYQYSYDANDHLIKSTCSQQNNLCPHGEVDYQWNSAGQMVTAAKDLSRSATAWHDGTETLHWVGNQLLFTTTNNGVLDDLKIGNMADISFYNNNGTASTTMTYWDRDLSGNQIGSHSGGKIGNAAPPGSQEKGYVGLSSTQTMLIYITEARSDGYSDGLTIFQGDRVMDTQLNHWMTRDSSSGSMMNPLSLKPYVYNNNNSQNFMDSSGDYPLGTTIGSAAASEPSTEATISIIFTVIAVFDIFKGLFGLFGGGDHPPETSRSKDYLNTTGAGGSDEGVPEAVQNLIAQLDKLYPRKAGKMEWHHLHPIYKGGKRQWLQVKIPASYHQLITNAWRKAFPYGIKRADAAEVRAFIKDLHEKLPLKGFATRGIATAEQQVQQAAASAESQAGAASADAAAATEAAASEESAVSSESSLMSELGAILEGLFGAL